MKRNLTFMLFIAILIVSCKKETVTPVQPSQPIVEMTYANLNDKQVIYQQNGVLVDVNNDSRADLLFDVQLIGDPIFGVDKRQYYVLSSSRTALPINNAEQIIPFNSKEKLPLENFNGNSWFTSSEIVLMERKEYSNGTLEWTGNWLNLQKKYLPFQIVQNNLRYNGWIELTADSNNERIVLHRMAISKEPEKEIRAGE